MTTDLDNIQFNAKIMKEYRITIPSAERNLLELSEGDFVIVTVQKLRSAQLPIEGKPSEPVEGCT